MILVIWRGMGFMIGVVGFFCLLMTNFVVDLIAGPGFYSQQRWPVLMAGVIAAAVCFPLGRAMNSRRFRQEYDPVKNEYVKIPISGEHALFFVPVEHWWMIWLALCGIAFLA